MSNELTPCPFCGSHHVELVCEWSTWYVRCNECDATGPGIMDGEDNDTGKAAAAWATRYAGDERRHVVCLCPDCVAGKPQNAAVSWRGETKPDEKDGGCTASA